MSRVPEEKREVNIVLVGMSADTGNLGVSALAEGTLEGLSAAGLWEGASAACAPIGAAASVEGCRSGKVSFALEGVRFSPRALGPNHMGVLWAKAFLLRMLPFQSLRARLVGKSAGLRALLEADAVLDISGGDSFTDIYGPRRMIGQFTCKLLPLILGKRLVLLPQTIGPFRRYPWLALARFVLKRSTLVYSRDAAGVDNVRRLTGYPLSSRIRYAPDVGFLVRPAGPGDVAPKQPGMTAQTTVGLNVSGLLWNGGYTRENQFGLKAEYRRVVGRVLNDFLREEGVRVRLIPHVVSPWRGGVENDEKACQDARAQLPGELQGRVDVVHGLRSAGIAKGAIGGCNFFVGSRMHSCIAALSQGIPTVGIAYSDKFRGVFESLEVGDCVADARREGEAGILRVIRDALARQDAIRATLARTVPMVEEQVCSAFRDIVELISDGRQKH